MADLGCWAVGRRLSQSVVQSQSSLVFVYYAVGPGTYWDKNYTRAILYYYNTDQSSRSAPLGRNHQSRGGRGGGGDRPMRSILVPRSSWPLHCCSTIKVSLFPSPYCKITTTKPCARGFKTISRRYHLLMQLYNYLGIRLEALGNL